jgi:hypothetical protein
LHYLENTMKRRLIWSVVAVAALACGSEVGPIGFGEEQGDGGMSSGSSGVDLGGKDTSQLIVDPPNPIVFIDTSTTPPTAGVQAFKVLRKTKAGETDVTASAVFTLGVASLGSFAGNTFTSATSLPPGEPGATSRIDVTENGASAAANVTVVALKRNSDSRDFFFLEPYNEAPSPANDTLKFKTNIQNVDVSFVMDTTGSMSGPISALKASVKGTLLAQLQAAIPSVGLSIVSHRDETDPPGELVSVKTKSTTNLALAQAGVDQLTLGDGDDFPEGQVPAMWHVLTGGAVTGVPAVVPAAGTRGAVGFRSGSVPVVVLITDALWHDPRGGVGIAMLNSAFTAANAKFVGVTSYNETQPNALSDATGSNLPTTAFMGCAAGKCCTGAGGAARAPSGPGGTCRLNYVYSSGNDIGNSVVQAIKAIAIGSVYDVTVKPKNDPTNPMGIDATKFIKALRAKDEGDTAEGCPPHAAIDTNGDGIKDTFKTVTVGTPVCFEVIPEMNTTVAPQESAIYTRADLEVVGVPGDIKLDSRKVLFLIPPKAAGPR